MYSIYSASRCVKRLWCTPQPETFGWCGLWLCHNWLHCCFHIFTRIYLPDSWPCLVIHPYLTPWANIMVVLAGMPSLSLWLVKCRPSSPAKGWWCLSNGPTPHKNPMFGACWAISLIPSTASVYDVQEFNNLTHVTKHVFYLYLTFTVQYLLSLSVPMICLSWVINPACSQCSPGRVNSLHAPGALPLVSSLSSLHRLDE